MADEISAGEDMPWCRGAGREDAVARLVALDLRGELATEHARAVAQAVGVSLRTVWNWVAVARREGRLSAQVRSRVGLSADVRARLRTCCLIERDRWVSAGGSGFRLGEAGMRCCVCR